ncbi:PREDICTED: LOW QUALITY PROTEIN: uncharacterized protein K02A2.6-like [Trachymyrmex cornetzi]|uniref:LOW QUALITY PROTEIN: uncharacterized protein K02A2.6-like n=1 Tax=Trachymyrmex cornetzi TaxID=471704 RepID=UPI00084F2EA6|nr:PREDICTED: LOW QUALITY PROTEIN: uncharacterized protein K02A2.6-like [Trachymyrmex cornetzi]
MEPPKGNNFTVIELKEALRERGLSSTGSKAELIQRLSEYDPNIWKTLSEKRNGIQGEQTDAEDYASIPEEHHESELQGEREDYTQHELTLIRKERELLQREQQLLRREREMNRCASTTSVTSVAGGVRNLRDLLPEFDASDNTFWRWKKQLEFVRNSYMLDDSATKILISTRLKGRALNWFYSRAEYLTLSVEDLLQEMVQMFDSRPSKLTLRKEFEARVWKTEESFCDYYHEKVILANRVPIAEDELLDYVIEGISDMRLQNQTRIMNFQTGTELLKAFEKIRLDSKRSNDFKQKQSDSKSSSAKNEASSTKKPAKCYKCQGTGHFAAQCKRPAAPATKRACYVCGLSDHLAKDCSERKQHSVLEAGGKSVQSTTTSTNVIQPAVLPGPYMVTVKISPSEKSGKVDTYVIDAIIDWGSPISIIRSSVIENESRSAVEGDTSQFVGINGARLKILNIFHGQVEVRGVSTKIKFYTVPDNTMAYKVLLGRDFLACPLLRITLGDDVEIENVEENSVTQIMHVETSEERNNIRDKLQVNPAIGVNKVEKISEIFETHYIPNFNAEKCGPDFEMNIALKHDQSISSRPRRLSFVDKEKLQKILDELSRKKIIRPSSSPYASPIVLVRKKTGDLRLCIDYRELNKITIRDNFPTELIDDNIDRLKGKKYFSILDLKDGFHHVKMHEASIKFTSFVTPLGQYEYLRMPFGLTNAPRVFQRFIHTVFERLVREHKILLYLDDILVATESLEEHFEILSELFELAGKSHLQFRLDKCYFAQTEIKYLGYCVNEYGIRPSDENIESVLNYPIPRNVKQIHQFVGLASYFRRFVPKFSLTAKPLYDLIKKGTVFRFGNIENQAFEALRNHLASKPVLAIYSPHAETELHCDASASGFGGILLQKQNDNTWRPISFWSQRTTPTEAKYHSFELECLAVVYALKRFHVYLAGSKFKIVTDCDSFRLTLNKKDVNPRISRWALFLQNYDYNIVHRPGKRMSHVDALSRCHSILVLEGSTFERTLSICQDRDKEILKIRDKLEKNDVKHYELRDGLVYRKDKNKKLLFYVPQSMESNVIRTCHDDIGHVGIDKVVENVAKVYWFPNMREKVKHHIENCLRCIEFSPPSGKAEGFLHGIPKESLPFATMHVDHIGPLEKTGKGYRHLLIVIDAFTKFIRIYPCKSTTTEESVKHLRDYFRAYSKPKRLISDRGTCFTSDAFKEFIKNESIVHVLVAVGTPRANGQVERFNRVITPMLAKLSETPSQWDRILNRVEYSLNNTVCRATNDTPSRLLFGVEQKGVTCDSLRDLLSTDTERDLEQIRNKAHVNIEKSQLENTKRYNLRRKPAREYKVGDYVEIRNVQTTPGVNKKLLPKFKGPYVIRKVLDYDRYVITDVDGFQLTQRPYTGCSARSDATLYSLLI